MSILKRTEETVVRGGGVQASEQSFEQLRDILLAPEQQQIAELREQLENPEVEAERLSRVLPAAVRRSTGRGVELASALTPAVESALQASVRRDPSVLIDAIFPIIGPAIRKAINEALTGLLQSLNQTLEHTLSPQSFKWRLEARRTGKSFAEVVLSRTLVYRVEQVFLIHKETGLLLQHVHRLDSTGSNADMVSGMLTAIQDFARDSLGVTRNESLETLQVGDLNVWLDYSPHVMLAAVIRGVAPRDFRTVLHGAIEHIHAEQRTLLDTFHGDPAPFEVVRPCLEDCLRLQIAERARKKRGPWLWIALCVALLLFVLASSVANQRQRERAALEQRTRLAAVEQDKARLAALAVQERARAEALAAEQARQRAEEARWSDFVNRLRSQEGIVVTDAGWRDGKFQVTGLRDPLAADPAGWSKQLGIDPAALVMQWQPYYALTPGLVLQRANRRLRPPPGVTLQLRDGDVLVASGWAPASWIESARRQTEAIPGISSFDASALRDETAAVLAAKKKAIDSTEIPFDAGVSMQNGQEEKVAQLAQEIAGLLATASGAGREVTITVIGHTSVEGTPAFNTRLGKARADAVIASLRTRLPDFTNFVAESAGALEASRPNAVENRRVNFRVNFNPPQSPGVPLP